MVHETWRLNHRISILNYNCYAGPGCQKVWDIDTSLYSSTHIINVRNDDAKLMEEI